MASGFNMRTAIRFRGERMQEALSLLSRLRVTPEPPSQAGATTATSTAPAKQESEHAHATARSLDQTFQAAIPCSETKDEENELDVGISAASYASLQTVPTGFGTVEENPEGQETETEHASSMVAQCSSRSETLVTQAQSSVDRNTSDDNNINLKELKSDLSSSESSNYNSGSFNWSSSDSNDDDVDMGKKKGVQLGNSLGSATADQMDFDVRRKPVENNAPGLQNALQVHSGSSADWAADVQLSFVNQQCLEKFVRELKDSMRGFGVCVLNRVMQPVYRQGVMRYQEGVDFVLQGVLQQRRRQFGVYLCRDKVTGQRFVIKKIETPKSRLAGYEFWVQNSRTYMPQIYAVFKEKDVVWIFQEFVENRLTDCQWSMGQVVEFIRSLLLAVHHMHGEGLAHCDLKIDNIMVKDCHRPDSLVLIDFDSAKHQDLPFQQEGQGHTFTYLPPCHQRILSLEQFDPMLMTHDLWAMACILIPLVLAAHKKVAPGRHVWAEDLDRMRRKCPDCEDNNICPNTLREFKNFLEKKGHTILKAHLAPLMTQCTDDLDSHWPTLYRLLEHLTKYDAKYIRNKTIDIALSILNC